MPRCRFPKASKSTGRICFAHACKVGPEGVVSKVRDSRYTSGRIASMTE